MAACLKVPSFFPGLTRRLYSKCPPLVIHEPVRDALAVNKPVVALESTILTHGMPFPHNLSMARAVEKIINDEGAVPATIAVVSGKVHVGLEDHMLERTAEAANGGAVKVSRRDLAYTLNQGLLGGTTISATMFLAHMAGIKLFVSGGLGGVHRGGETSMDVSADLTELGRTPVALVTSGVKSILDIGRTLEYLETLGVCVATFGPTKQFPAFFTRNSSHNSACNVRDVREAAQLVHTTFSLGLNSGLVIANPIPEEYEMQEVEGCIQEALSDLSKLDIKGRDITPYILKRVNELTSGKSLLSNIALVENNARLGAKIAVELSSIEGNGYPDIVKCSRVERTKEGNKRVDVTDGNVTVIGACNMDNLLHIHNDPIEFSGQTNNATSTMQYGGVGRNLCDGLSRLGIKVSFLSALGKDISGERIVNSCRHMDWKRVLRLTDCNTAHYSVVLNKEGNVVLGIGDMNIHEKISPQYIEKNEQVLTSSSLIVMDANLSMETITTIGELASAHHIPVFYEPTDVDKANKLFTSAVKHCVTYIKPNINEFTQIYYSIIGKRVVKLDEESPTFVHTLSELCTHISSYIPYILVTLGSRGVLLCVNHSQQPNISIEENNEYISVIKTDKDATCVHVKVPVAEQICSVSGAGDCLAIGFIYGQLRDLDVISCMKLGVKAASLSLQSYENVPASITDISQLDLRSL